MRISHKHKFVFIAIPRTGSTSLRSALDSVADIKSVYKYEVTDQFPFYHHITARELREVFITNNWDWNEYRKFAVVRNPFDRCVSLYHHRLETGNRYAVGKSKAYNTLRKLKYTYGPKKTFAQWLPSKDAEINLCASIKQFTCSDDGTSLMDYFVKFENLHEDFSDVSRQLGIESITNRLLKKNSSKVRDSYQKYYNDELIEFVKQKYEYEFEKFSYAF